MPILGSFTSGRAFGRSGGGGGSFIATGGSITDSGGYRYHYFTGSNSITFTNVSPTDPVEILMVGAGGGSSQYAGGAGGGEVLVISKTIATGTYPISIGSGGASNGDRNSAYPGRRGQETTAFGETAKGGGSGLNSDEGVPSGGSYNGPHPPSGNGGAGSSRTAGYFGVQGTSVGPGVTRYGGKRGGQESTNNNAPLYPGHGGGGANQSRTGNTGGGGNGGTGGAGIQVPGVGLNYYWGGGGGGGVYYGGTAGPGGLGGGGGGSAGNNAPGGGSAYNNGGGGSGSTGGSGGANTGGGGGGGRGQTGGPGGSGGSGMVIVRYPI
jgi:hypothetical protein